MRCTTAIAALAAATASTTVLRMPDAIELKSVTAPVGLVDETIYGTVSVCSDPDALATNLVASSNSTSPKVGDYVGLTFTYDIAEDIPKGAQAEYACTINGFLPYTTSADICGSDASPCPFAAGTREDVGAIAVSSGISKLKCTITWTMPDKRQILCAAASWTVAA